MLYGWQNKKCIEHIIFTQMNRKIYILGIIMMAFFAACEKEETGIPPAPVTDVEVTGGYGEVMLSWTNPSSEGFKYVDIRFTDSGGVNRSEKVSKYANADTIPGFANTEAYNFTLTAYNEEGLASDPVSVVI